MAAGPEYREHGPRRAKRVAITLDGGPTGYTSPALRILRRNKVHATFFIRGQFVHGRARLLRQELREGHELANHSYTHPHFPSYAELRRTQRLIRGVTGFRPCLFRAPYGDINRRLLHGARQLGMLTIQWDVDSFDSLGANTSTVYRRVVDRVHPGSIVLLHDGEGSHPATLRALPGILHSLRHRGYSFVTVSELLHLRPIYSNSPRGPASHA